MPVNQVSPNIGNARLFQRGKVGVDVKNVDRRAEMKSLSGLSIF